MLSRKKKTFNKHPKHPRHHFPFLNFPFHVIPSIGWWKAADKKIAAYVFKDIAKRNRDILYQHRSTFFSSRIAFPKLVFHSLLQWALKWKFVSYRTVVAATNATSHGNYFNGECCHPLYIIAIGVENWQI